MFEVQVTARDAKPKSAMNHGTKRVRNLGITGILLAFVAVVMVIVWHWLTPRPIMGSLRLSYGGITNAAGEILINVTNGSRWEIDYFARVETKVSGLWPPYPSNIPSIDLAKRRRIAARTTASFSVLPPTNDGTWRIWVDYYALTERNQRVEKIQGFLSGIGLGGIGYRIPQDFGGYVLLPESADPFNRQGD